MREASEIPNFFMTNSTSDIRWIQRFQNFEKAYLGLREGSVCHLCL
jgi:hypothetical protein